MVIEPSLSRDSTSPPASGFAQVTRDMLMFAGGSVVAKGIGVVMLPILTRSLSPQEYGRADAVTALATAITVVVSLQLDAAALRLFYDRGSATGRRRLLSTWFLTAASVTVPTAILLVALATPITHLLYGDPSMVSTVAAGGLVVGAGIAQIVVLTVLRANRRPIAYAVVNGASAAVYALLAVLLLRLWRADSVAVVLAWGLGLSLSGAAGLLAIRGEIFARPTLSDLRGLMRLGLPLMPGGILIVVAESVNRAYLLMRVGPAEVAYFGVGVRFASVAGLVVWALEIAWLPRAYALTHQSETTRIVAAVGRGICTLVASMVVVVAMLSPEILAVVTDQRYRSALPVIGVCLVSTLASGFLLVGTVPMAMARSMGKIGLTTGAGAAISMGANVGLAPGGAVGTAVAVALGQFSAAAIVIAWCVRTPMVRYPWRRMLLTGGAAAIVVVGAIVLTDAPLPVRLSLLLAWAAGIYVEGTGREVLAFVRSHLEHRRS